MQHFPATQSTINQINFLSFDAELGLPEIFKSFVKNGHQEYSDAGANHGPFRVDGPLLEEDGLFEPSVEVHLLKQ